MVVPEGLGPIVVCLTECEPYVITVALGRFKGNVLFNDALSIVSLQACIVANRLTLGTHITKRV